MVNLSGKLTSTSTHHRKVKLRSTAAVNLPQINNLKRTIHSQRKDDDSPPTPLRREDIPVLPERYQVTKAGEQFLIFDSGVGDNERILIFATQQGIRFLSNNSHWFMDGTFKLCPEIFYQRSQRSQECCHQTGE